LLIIIEQKRVEKLSVDLRARRENVFKFGGLEWRNIIQREYLLWPKRDRRLLDRRSLGRRKGYVE